MVARGRTFKRLGAFMMRYAIVTLAAGVVISAVSNAHAVEWVMATVPSCANTCTSAGRTPVSSGVYVNGEKFYVCSANAYGEGFRTGYNLRPNWANACIVGWGGREEGISSYYCLCN